MSMSAFFRALHASYQAELEDLTSDSEGRNVLRQRLLEKRSQVAFLRQMLEISPEMVAVVFHGGFHFELPAAMEHLLTLESDEFPDWDSLADVVRLTPWAQELAATFLSEAQGPWFMTVAAALEYLQQRPSAQQLQAMHEGEAQHETHVTHGRHHDHGHDFDADDELNRRHDHDHDHDHEESSADWLEAHGFDRKD